MDARSDRQSHGWAGEVTDACRGGHWPLRALMWGWFVFLLWHHVRSAEYQSFLGGLNLGIHEFGHLICGPLGQFLGVLGGSLMQCLVPVISFLMFYRQRDFFAFAFSFVWLGSNLLGVARYMADARALRLPLVSPFGGNGEVIHDWNFILHRLGWLAHDTTIAGVVRGFGLVAMAIGVLWGAWILWLMIRHRSPRREIGDQWQASDLEL